jgi:subfamily B ATP-binding cassette protein MsbA
LALRAEGERKGWGRGHGPSEVTLAQRPMTSLDVTVMDGPFHNLKRVLREGRSYIPTFLFMGGLGLAILPVEFYALILSRKLIDQGFLLQNWLTIRETLLILIVLFMVRSSVAYTMNYLSASIQFRMNQKFQNEVFSHLIRLPVRFFTQEPTGQLMSRVLDDAARFSAIFNQIFGQALLDPLKLLVLIAFLAYFNLSLCVLMTISFLGSFLVIRWMGHRLHLISKGIQRQNAATYTFVGQVFSNIELVKSKAAEQMEARNFFHLVDQLIGLSLKTLKVTLVTQPLLQALKYATLGAVFIYGSWMISASLITVGTLTVFLGATYLLFNVLHSLGRSYGALRENLARLEIIFSLLDSPPEHAEPARGKISPLGITSLEFKDVSFSYAPPHLVLDRVSFAVYRGETLGITGQSGSGKTTLMRLLLRFYEPTAGEMRLNGHVLGEFDVASVRAATGIVFQDNLILNDTVKNNIAYGNSHLSMEDIINAARVSRAHDFIMALPSHYETTIGEQGKLLSGGEKQRLAVARAIVTEPDILILDEGTSFLEVAQEEAILASIRQNRAGKITIIISHRLSAMRHCDRILTLDNGRVLESNIPSLIELPGAIRRVLP